MTPKQLLKNELEALAEARSGKRTLRTHEVAQKPEVTITSEELKVIREQGRAVPNAQAALLIRLVEKYPDTVARLASV